MPKNSNEYQRKYQNEWYKNQSVEYKERQKILKEKRTDENKKFLIEKRSVPCHCCQEIHPQEIMEFHHIENKYKIWENPYVLSYRYCILLVQ